jgi:hypothetical protein
MSKRIVRAAGILVWAIPTFASVAPVCENGTVQDYVNLGSTGCSFGTALFYNFVVEPVQPSIMPLDPSTFQLDPFAYPGPGSPGFVVVQTKQVLAGPNEVWELLLHFDVAAQIVNGATVDVDGYNSELSAALDLCAGGSFPDGTPSGCSGNFASAEAFVSSTLPPHLSDSTSFPGASGVDTFFDLREASGSTATDFANVTDFKVATVPEPATIPLVGIGLGALIFYIERRRLKRVRR